MDVLKKQNTLSIVKNEPMTVVKRSDPLVFQSPNNTIVVSLPRYIFQKTQDKFSILKKQTILQFNAFGVVGPAGADGSVGPAGPTGPPGPAGFSPFVQNGNTLELWWNGALVASWTVTPVTPAAGSYMGFGGLTYA